MTSRRVYVDDGRLTECTNPPHWFTCFGVVWCWQWSSNRRGWSVVTDRGMLHTDYFCIGKMESQDGLCGVRIVVGRLAILGGVLKRGGRSDIS